METFHTPMVTLNDGNLIPQIGLGVLRIDDEGVTPVRGECAGSRLPSYRRRGGVQQ